MRLHFKVDDKGHLWLLFASLVEIVRPAHPHPSPALTVWHTAGWLRRRDARFSVSACMIQNGLLASNTTFDRCACSINVT
jgi:hypothetical protein